jgi:hypothetical protein
MSIQSLTKVSGSEKLVIHAEAGKALIGQISSTRWASSPEIFTDFFQENTNICIWERKPSAELKPYVQALRAQNIALIRSVDLEDISKTLNYMLPDFATEGAGASKLAFIDELSMLIDMVCCLFDCESVGLRLTVLNRAMCPKFHTDKISGRLICTYSGKATEWLNSNYPNMTSSELIASALNDCSSEVGNKTSSFTAKHDCAKAGDVLLLKGEAWPGNENNAIVHRSPSVAEEEARLLLTIDPT